MARPILISSSRISVNGHFLVRSFLYKGVDSPHVHWCADKVGVSSSRTAAAPCVCAGPGGMPTVPPMGVYDTYVPLGAARIRRTTGQFLNRSFSYRGFYSPRMGWCAGTVGASSRRTALQRYHVCSGAPLLFPCICPYITATSMPPRLPYWYPRILDPWHVIIKCDGRLPVGTVPVDSALTNQVFLTSRPFWPHNVKVSDS